MKPNTNKPFIIVVTGVATSGKSTLLAQLRLDGTIRGVKFLDMDRAKLPQENREIWRLARLEKLFRRAVDNNQNSQSSIIFGIGLPSEIINSSAYSTDLSVGYILLTLPIKDYENRMKRRIIKQLGTGAFRRHYVKQWNSENLAYTRELSRQLKKEVGHQANKLIIDTSKLDPIEVSQLAAEYIKLMTIGAIGPSS